MRIEWKKNDYNSEVKNFEKTINVLSKDPKTRTIYTSFFKKEYGNYGIVNLSDGEWSKMKNTDSYSTISIDKIIKVKDASSTDIDIGSTLNDFISGKVIAPIAMRLKDNKLYLISGNDRLMVARWLKIDPRIVIIKTNIIM